MKKYLLIIAVLFTIYITTKNNNVYINEKAEKNNQIIAVSYNDENLSIPIDEYVLGVLACEMPASFEEEALKAEAVAIRTFYIYKKNANANYIAKNTDQCFISESKMKENWKEKFEYYYNKLKKIVNNTKDEYITYDGEVIASFYYSLSNGFTENVQDVFSVNLPYLISVSSPWDINVSSFENRIQMNMSDFLNKLNLQNADHISIKNISKNESGRVNSIEINDSVFSGIEIRKLLNLKSADFSIIANEDNVTIITKGNGHGVGMSQYGSNEMAKLGYSYDKILSYYYKDTKISKLDV